MQALVKSQLVKKTLPGAKAVLPPVKPAARPARQEKAPKRFLSILLNALGAIYV